MLNHLDDFLKDYFKKEEERKKRNAKIKALEENAITLSDIRFQKRTYETVIPIVYGEILLAGNIIWLSDIRNFLKSTNQRFFNLLNLGISQLSNPNKPPEKLYLEYYIDLAIAICEGVVDELLGVYISGKAVDISEYNFRFYKGDETQMPDPLIQKEKGVGEVPAFRGLCYCVFENFNLTEFGSAIPSFEFFIRRSNFAKGESVTARVKKNLKGVNLMPGSGEFVYETQKNATYNGFFYNDDNMVDGTMKHSNVNTFYKKADALVSLDLLKEDLPNTNWVSLVVTWFADSIDISKANIYPAVEFNDLETVSKPVFWKCMGKTRWQTRQVSRRADGMLNYGGTICDASVVSILKELKSRGYKVVLYPMLFLDLPEKPWRGRIHGSPESVKSFFTKTEGYNRFIKHYANLSNGLCDAFIVGSEMKGLTSIKASDGSFPAVIEFEKLAGEIKKIMPNTKLSYAADWSEYHSHEGCYNMDTLWASPNIDFIGIDAYFPLTNVKKRPTIQEIKDGWQSGEGYDFYFQGEERIKYKTPDFAWKNIRHFFENEHTNVDGTKTAFKPKSKKIWFTEFGFPSVDLGTNQPNVFYDPTSSESFLPKFSKGLVDFEFQKEAIHATLEFIAENSDIIENAFAWCYDLRPYPFFPKRKDIWKDADLWQRGHWLNGKLGSSTFDEVVRELGLKSGFTESELVFEDCNEIIEGMCINKDVPFSNYIKMLCDLYFIKMVPCQNGLKFKSIEKSNFSKEINLNSENILIRKNRHTSKLYESEEVYSGTPSKILLSFVDKTNRYEISNTSFQFKMNGNEIQNRLQINAPVVFSKERASQIIQNLFKQRQIESEKRSYVLPFNYNFLNPADSIIINDEKVFIENIKFDDEFNVYVEGVRVVNLDPFISENEDENEILMNNFLFENSSFLPIELPIELPNFSTENSNQEVQIYFFAKNLKPNSKLYYSIEGFTKVNFLGNLTKEQIKGKIVLGELNQYAVSEILDSSSYIEVFIENTTKNISFESGTAIIGGEICDFQKVTPKGGGLFAIFNFVRQKFGGKKIKGFTKDDFLVISQNTHVFSLPSYLQKVTFIVSEGLKAEQTQVPFEIENTFNSKYYIARKSQILKKEGILLCWVFCEYCDFEIFDKGDWRNLEIEIYFPNYNKTFITKGESFLLTKEIQIEAFSQTFSYINFDIKIIS